MNNKPLVSIIVLTYNSSDFVIETLESIKNQTYTNIELIIGDDCSTDNTLQICSEWLCLNDNLFVSSRLISARDNEGIPANCNRTIKAARGNWIKMIAGDDTLLINCIEDNVDYVISHPEVLVLQSETYIIDEKSNRIGISKPIDFYFKHPNITAYFQHQLLLRKYIGNTTTLFVSKNVIEKVGYYDESIKLMEDTPMWLKLTEFGYKIFFMDVYTTNYRKNFDSVSFDSRNTKIVNSIYYYNILTSKKYVLQHLNGLELFLEKYRHYITLRFLESAFNKNMMLYRFLWLILSLPFILSKKKALFHLNREINNFITNNKVK